MADENQKGLARRNCRSTYIMEEKRFSLTWYDIRSKLFLLLTEKVACKESSKFGCVLTSDGSG